MKVIEVPVSKDPGVSGGHWVCGKAGPRDRGVRMGWGREGRKLMFLSFRLCPR